MVVEILEAQEEGKIYDCESCTDETSLDGHANEPRE